MVSAGAGGIGAVTVGAYVGVYGWSLEVSLGRWSVGSVVSLWGGGVGEMGGEALGGAAGAVGGVCTGARQGRDS